MLLLSIDQNILNMSDEENRPQKESDVSEVDPKGTDAIAKPETNQGEAESAGKNDVDIASPKEQAEEKDKNNTAGEEDEDEAGFFSLEEEKPVDPEIIAQAELVKNTEPTTALEIALASTLERKDAHIQRLTTEITKLRAFISKRKQVYKRKRKDEEAPRRALSAYNLFIKERFAQLAKENEEALKSTDADAVLKRVPPANLVARTGNEWKELPAEIKAKYEERYVH